MLIGEAAMWQVTVAGLVADVIGFVLIAYEWHRTFKYTEEMRQEQLQDAYERNEAREQGRKPVNKFELEDELMAKDFSKLRLQEALFRERLFFLGVGLVILGFVLQVIGALPIDTAKALLMGCWFCGRN